MRETAVPDVTGFIYSAGFLLGLHSVFRSGTRYFSLPASLQHSLLSFHAGRKSADISGTYTLQIALWRHARAPVCVSVRVCSCSCNCKRGFRASSARATGCQRVGRDATQKRGVARGFCSATPTNYADMRTSCDSAGISRTSRTNVAASHRETRAAFLVGWPLFLVFTT